MTAKKASLTVCRAEQAQSVKFERRSEGVGAAGASAWLGWAMVGLPWRPLEKRARESPTSGLLCLQLCGRPRGRATLAPLGPDLTALIRGTLGGRRAEP